MFRLVGRADLLPVLLPWFDNTEVVGHHNEGSFAPGVTPPPAKGFSFADLATDMVLVLRPDFVDATANPGQFPYSADVRARVKAKLLASKAK